MSKALLSRRHPEKYAVYKRLINSYAWQLLRNKKIASQPLCEDCLANGRVTVAEEVHHRIPVEQGRDYNEMRQLAYNFSNLVSLCKACHRARHAPQVVEKEKNNRFGALFFGDKK
jgi:5-methylcytosine-specific restriction protein A